MTDDDIKRAWLKRTTEKIRTWHMDAMRDVADLATEQMLVELQKVCAKESEQCAAAKSDGQYAANRIWREIDARRTALEAKRAKPLARRPFKVSAIK